MKIKLLDATSLTEEIPKYLPDYNFKNSESFAVIKDNKVVQAKLKPKYLEPPVVSYPNCDFIIQRLDKDIEFNGYKYSDYRIQIPDTLDKWYFADLNWFRYFRIQFNANKTILNKSNIHKVLYAIGGGLIGAWLIKLLIK